MNPGYEADQAENDKVKRFLVYVGYAGAKRLLLVPSVSCIGPHRLLGMLDRAGVLWIQKSTWQYSSAVSDTSSALGTGLVASVPSIAANC